MGRLQIDFLTVLLVVLTISVQIGAIWMAADPLREIDKPAPVKTAENDASTAVPILVLLLLELVVIYLAWLAYKRLPGWVKKWVKRGLLAGGVGYALLYALVIMPLLLVVYAVMALAYWRGHEWVAYDIGALGLAVVVAATLGGYFGPAPLGVLILALMVYDWVSVIETSIMDNIVRVMAELKLPVMVVIPKRLDFDLGSYLDRIAAGGVDDGPGSVHLAIGAGDFAIPAALTAAVFRYYGAGVASAVMLGTIAGLILLLETKDDDALPGLPWLGGGALGGMAVGLVVVMAVA